jgi:hypothetical protein
MGVYSTCQFLGAFAGGAAGGWLLQQWDQGALLGVCLLLAACWWLVVLMAAHPIAGSREMTTNSLSDT